jgi:hypothetical protein
MKENEVTVEESRETIKVGIDNVNEEIGGI